MRVADGQIGKLLLHGVGEERILQQIGFAGVVERFAEVSQPGVVESDHAVKPVHRREVGLLIGPPEPLIGGEAFAVMPLLVEYEGFHFADVMQLGALLGDVGEPGFGLLQITGDRIALSEPVEGQQHRGDAPHVKLRRADLRGQRERFAQHADTLFVTLEVGQDGSFGRSCENGLRRVAAAVGRFDRLAGVFERLPLSGD